MFGRQSIRENRVRSFVLCGKKKQQQQKKATRSSFPEKGDERGMVEFGGKIEDLYSRKKST